MNGLIGLFNIVLVFLMSSGLTLTTVLSNL